MKPRTLAILPAAIFFATSLTSHAASLTWSGTTDSAWNNSANWTAAGTPANGDQLFFNGTFSNQPTNNNLTSLNLASLNFGSGLGQAVSLGGNALTLTAQAAVTGVNIARAGSLATVTSTGHGLSSGQFVTVSGATTTSLNGTFLITVLDANTYTYTSTASGTIAGETANYSVATLANANTTASRNLTIDNDIALSGDQSWGIANDVDAVTIVSGDLSGTGNLTLATNQSNGNTNLPLPNLRLSGTNSGYSGTITPFTTNGGLLLASPAAMTGGLIDLNSGDRNLWLTGGAGTYTFGINGTETTGARVAFRGSGTGGLYLTGGDVTWNPGGGTDYTWSGATGLAIDFAGSNDTTPRMLSLGNSSGSFIISGANKTFRNGTNGNNASRVTLLSALTDDAGTQRTLTSSLNLLVLSKAAVNDADPLNLAVTGGAVAVSNLNRLPGGNLNLNGGVLILDGISWSTFAASRSVGTGNSQFQGVGFAARNGNLVIPNDGSGGLSSASFDANAGIGSPALAADGSIYASGDLTIQTDTSLSALRTYRLANNGTGMAEGNPTLNEFSGNLSGTGSLVVSGTTAGTTTISNAGELLLSGANSWSGSPSFQVNGAAVTHNAGPGGLIAYRAIIRFDEDASLPTGNGGSPAFLSAVQRNDAYMPFGFLLTGDATGKTYDLPTGYKFLIGTQTSSNPSPFGVFGASGGKATLQSSSICLNGNDQATMTFNFLTRSGSELKLGTSGNPVKLIPSTGYDGAAAASATTLIDVTTGLRTLIKRGEGTLALDNLAYTKVDGTTDASASFTWQLGRGGSNNTVAAPYFDGAVRSSTGLAGFLVKFQGGVLETSGSFTRARGTTAADVQWAQGGGGFAANGGPLTVNIGGALEQLTWASTGSFVTASNPLILGSQTANDVVTFQNDIILNNAQREIRVIDNTASTADKAVISGEVFSTATNSAIIKTGNGVLELSGTNEYPAATSVAGGTLLITGNSAAINGAVTVASGAALGGSGTLGGATTIESGGGMAFVISTDATSHDKFDLSSSLTFNGSTVPITITSPGGIAAGTYTLATASGISGTPTFTCSMPAGWNGNAFIDGSDLKLTVSAVGGASPYDDWADDFPGFSPTTPSLDYDKDGLSNLLEFVLGGNPTISQAGIAPTVTSASGTDLVVSFKRSDASELAPATAVKVQVSADLATWNPADDITIGAGPTGTGPNGASYTVDDTGTLDTVVLTIPKAAAAKKFARVVATQP